MYWERESDNDNGCITTNQPDTKSNSNSNANSNPTTKQHPVVSIQLYYTCKCVAFDYDATNAHQ